jgi:predicted RNA-binding Zn-ribbon protein involved in translation (DUF1610 family)
MSSGSVIYTDTPIFYYGILGVGVLMIIIIVFTMYNIFQGKPILFSRDSDSNKYDNSESKHSVGLQKVFEAEENYQEKHYKSPKGKKIKSRKKQKTDKETNEKREEILNKTEKKKRRPGRIESESNKGKRIGSVPLEESIYTERYTIQKKEEHKKPKEGKKITTFLCPSCGSKELYYEAGLISGYKYHCKDCDYIGSFVIEKDFKI